MFRFKQYFFVKQLLMLFNNMKSCPYLIITFFHFSNNYHASTQREQDQCTPQKRLLRISGTRCPNCNRWLLDYRCICHRFFCSMMMMASATASTIRCIIMILELNRIGLGGRSFFCSPQFCKKSAFRIILHPDSYCIDRLIIGEPVSASAFLLDLILMVSWYCIMDLSKGNRSTIQHLLCHVLRYRCIFGDGFHNHFIDFP